MVQSFRIAALDDEACDLALLEEHLRNVPGWEVSFEGVASVEAFRTLLARSTPDVTFLDHDLGADDGLRVLEEMRRTGDRCPVVALTGQEDQRIAAQYILSGADAYLMKHDLCPELLACTIEAVIARRRMEHEIAFLEEQLQQARRYEAIGSLTGGLAHDFNNMLVSIKGNIELATLEGVPDKAGTFLSRADRTCALMAELTAVLLRFGRSQSAGKDLIDVAATTRDVGMLFKHMLPEGMTLAVESPEEPLILEADGAMIRHVLHGLLKNALEASPVNGRITLRVRREVIDTRIRCQRMGIPSPQLSRDDAILEVIDQGPGMPPEVRERAFDPYFSTRRRYDVRGSGLGLAIVWHIVRQHGGTVHIESAEGSGTKVTVRFPPFV